MKLTLEMRQAAKAEHATQKKKRGMSATAVARLQEKKEQDSANRIANARLVEHFNSHPQTVESVMDWLNVVRIRELCALGRFEICTDERLLRRGKTENIRKRAVKCFHFLTRGFKVYEIHDLNFFAELLPGEERLPLLTILNRYPSSVDTIVPALAEPTAQKLCALGSKCARAVRRKAATVTGTGKYCSGTCKGRAMSIAKRTKSMAATA